VGDKCREMKGNDMTTKKGQASGRQVLEGEKAVSGGGKVVYSEGGGGRG
jgi:hypothetical protein